MNILRQCEHTGRPVPDEMQAAFRILPAARPYWDAFQVLSAARPAGGMGGPAAIPVTEIFALAQEEGLDSEITLRLVQELDAVFFEEMRPATEED